MESAGTVRPGASQPRRRGLAAALLLAASAVAAACSPPPTAGSDLPPQATALPTPTPPLVQVEEIHVYPNSGGDGWCAGGLIRNTSATAVQVLALDLVIDQAHGSPARRSFPLDWADLRPGEAAPFEVPLGAERPQGVEVVPVAAGLHGPRGAPALAQDTRLVRDGLRRQHALGWVLNPGQQAVDVVAALIVARDAEGAIVDVAPMSEGAFRLEPGQRRPFVARLAVREAAASIEAYVDAVPMEAGTLPPLIEADGIHLRLGMDGLPYWVGLARNSAAAPQWVSGVASFTAEGDLVGVAELGLPVPVMPGESMAFALYDVPGIEGWVRGGGDPARLQVRLWLDGRLVAEAAEIRPLGLSVKSVEAIGGTLFLRGQVQAAGDEAAERAWVVAAVRDTAGNLISAGSTEVSAEVRPGQAAEYLLALPLPAGVQLAGLEYDLRAAAVR